MNNKSCTSKINEDNESMDELLTSDELAAALKVTRQTIYNWQKEGMPVIKAGRNNRYILRRVLRWLEKGKQGGC